MHLWSGLIAGLYVVAISSSGSVLVFRNELRARFDPQPRHVDVVGERLDQAGLVAAGERAFDGAEVEVDYVPDDPTLAASLLVERRGREQQILVDPYTGEILGNALPFGWRATTWLLELHDNLLAGERGRTINGIGAVTLSVLAGTGLLIWWPGRGRVRRALLVRWRGPWRRVIWSFHGALGAWSVAFVALWGLTGIYLCFPEPFQALVDRIEPIDPESFDPRVGDTVLYWVAYVHFGRFGGDVTKWIWATVGLVPPTLFVTGLVMWWNRVLRRRFRRVGSSSGSERLMS